MVESQSQHEGTDWGRGDIIKTQTVLIGVLCLKMQASTYSKRSGTDQRIFRQHLLDYNKTEHYARGPSLLVNAHTIFRRFGRVCTWLVVN